MNKKTIAAIIGLTAIVATPAFAKDNKKANAPECRGNKTEQCTGDKQCPVAVNPFEGLNLTTQQQEQIKALKDECKAQRQAQAKERKDNAQKAKADKANGKREMRAAQLAKIKAILTPEQYVQFLENSFVNGDNMPKVARDGKDNKRPDMKGQRDKGQRPQRGERPAPAQN